MQTTEPRSQPGEVQLYKHETTMFYPFYFSSELRRQQLDSVLSQLAQRNTAQVLKGSCIWKGTPATDVKSLQDIVAQSGQAQGQRQAGSRPGQKSLSAASKPIGKSINFACHKNCTSMLHCC